MPAQYHVRLKDNATGQYVAWLDEAGAYQQLQVGHTLNGPGVFRVEISDEDERRSLFTLDTIVEVWRAHVDFGLDWYREFAGLMRSSVREHLPSDVRKFTAYGSGLNDLLRRRIIAYKAGDAKTNKNGDADDVMKAFVRENAGSLATVVNGRLASGVVTGFGVQADAGAGSTWSGARAWTNLLDALREIADESGVDFEVVLLTGVTFEFRTYWPQRGTDRSLVGLVPTTGLNGAGNVPVVFEIGNFTMLDPSLTFDRRAEVNRVYGLGQGEEQYRAIQTANKGTLQDDSPWNVYEEARNVSQQSMDAVALLVSAQGRLDEKMPKRQLMFKTVQKADQLYGKHYFLGDRVSARFSEFEGNYKIVGATLSYAPGVEAGEAVELEVNEF